jgi:hypothetical protein
MATIRTNLDKEEQPGLAAGVTDAARDLLLIAPRLLSLQRALTGGASARQTREARRLEKKYGSDHALVVAARARAAGMVAEGSRIDSGVNLAGKFTEPLLKADLFSGYVVDASGAAAANHTVRLTARTKGAGKFSGKTDKDGYFRIDISGAKRTPGDPLTVLKAHLAVLESRAAANATQKAAGAAVDNKQTREFDLAILDPSGKVVHQEQLPVLIGVGRSTFRYFVLADTIVKPEPKSPAKTRKAATKTKAR